MFADLAANVIAARVVDLLGFTSSSHNRDRLEGLVAVPKRCTPAQADGLACCSAQVLRNCGAGRPSRIAESELKRGANG